ncbi:MAG: hypothetical protein IT365_28160, partial [Candidatus Hydrogenedentes bacterium]|nr:hypothetical protein [Candidatus Hydrogenedentota bacterium]
ETRKEAVELAANRTPDDAQSLLQQWRESKASDQRAPQQAQAWGAEVKALPAGVQRDLRKAVRHSLEALPNAIGWRGWMASELQLITALAAHLHDNDALPILKKKLHDLQPDSEQDTFYWGSPQTAGALAEAIVALEGEKAVDYFAELAGDVSCDRGSRIAALIALGQIGTEKSAAAFKRLRDAAYDRPNAPPRKETYTHAERMAETAHMIFWVLTTDLSSPLARPFEPKAFTGATVSENYGEGTLNTTMFGGWTDLHFRRVGEEWLLARIGSTMVE